MDKLARLLSDDSGAVTTDWIALSAGLLIAGLTAIHAIYNSGVSDLVLDMNAQAEALVADLDPGAAENINQ